MTHFPSHQGDSAPRVLFFGRQNCEGTQKGLAHLSMLGFAVDFIQSGRPGKPMPAAVHDWRGDYIFCFRSYHILSRAIIDQARIAAINFHPAPTEYPGSGCINFALYDDASSYGVTAHIMNEKVDNGAILKCDRFPIHPADTVQTLLERTHHALLGLFYDIVSGIAEQGAGFIETCQTMAADERWRGMARRMSELNELQRITPDISAEELKRRIRAVHTEAFPLLLDLHDQSFALTLPARKV